MSGLFATFERRPDSCQAVYVRNDNIDQLARYYAEMGYETRVYRGTRVDAPPDWPEGTALTLAKEGEPMIVVRPGQALKYGHPPEVDDGERFLQTWRPSQSAVVQDRTP